MGDYTRPRIHMVACTLISSPEGSGSFTEADRLANKLEVYARRLGFSVLHDNVDRGEPLDEVSPVLADFDRGDGDA